MGNKAALLSVGESGEQEYIVFDAVSESTNSQNYRTLIPYFL